MATFTVSTGAQFKTALQSARGGDKILLKEGDYGHLEMRGTQDSRFVYSGEVTVASADPGNPAVLKSMLLRDVKNLTFDGIKFDLVSTSSTGLNASSFKVDVSSDITFKNTTFDGDVYKGTDTVEKGYGTGFGLQVLRSDNVTVEDSSFSTFRVATQFQEIKNLVVRNNTFDSVSGDNLKFAAITTGLIEGNYIKNIRANPDSSYHSDMIQFLTYGTDIPSTDIVIRGNVLNSGDSNVGSQSIFMRNEAVDTQGAGKGMYYSNILIEDNVIYNAHANGIWVHHGDGLNIRHNTVLQNSAGGDGHPVYTPLILIANSVDVDIVKNVTHKIVTSNTSDLQSSGNYIVQRVDPTAANYYDKLFVDPDPGAGIEGLQALPGGTIETLGVGSDLTREGDAGGGGAAAAVAYDLVVSDARSRSGAVDLKDATLSDDAFVFVTGTADARKVSFWLDGATGTADQVENKYWHDFAGTAADGRALAWDTTDLSEGRHTITAEIIDAGGSRHLISDSFIIDNI